MAFRSTSRRRDLRRTASRVPRWWHLGVGKAGWLAALWVIVFSVVASLLAFNGQGRQRYREGDPVTMTRVARVPFTAVDQDETNRQRNLVRARVPQVYKPNSLYIEKVRNTLLSLGRLGADPKIETIEQVPQETRDRLWLRTIDRFTELRRYVMTPGNVAWDTRIAEFMTEFTALPLLRPQRVEAEVKETSLSNGVVLRQPVLTTGGVTATAGETRDLFRGDEELMDFERDRKVLEGRLAKMLEEKLPQALQRIVIDIVLAEVEPLYMFDAEETARRQAVAENDVAPVEVKIEPNQLLVKAGTRLTSTDIRLLNREREQYDLQMGTTSRWLLRAGRAGMIMLIGVGLWVYVAAYNQRIIRNFWRGLAVVGLLLLCQALAVSLSLASPEHLAATASAPALLGAMILSIVYDRRFAMAVGAMLTVLILLSLDLSVGFSLVMLSGVTIAASRLPDVRNRSTLVAAGLWTGLGMAVAMIFVGLSGEGLRRGLVLESIYYDAARCAIGALITGLLIQGLLPGIERIFKVTTSMTLKDLNDAAHPLLRRLAEEAPGTYQHSLRIADMAEAAAEAIGANTRLCRVGAMYHDIGKVNKPAYFVENQAGGPNKHDKLRPAMSVLVIVGHVKDGAEMARDYKLPRPIIHIIESHHGTTLVEYFYHAAKRISEGQDAAEPAEFDYRYPGPKPQNKEAAILMLCDSVEAAARCMPEPTPVRLEQLVNKMLNKRLMDGQFDECAITLQELHKVEQAVVKTLTAIYHGRISYPAAEPREQSQAAGAGA